MKTRNAMQLKALVNSRARVVSVSPQLMLQNYMLERLIDRISRSEWHDSIIVKGGGLIGSLIGVDRRTTKDLDTTVAGLTLTHEKVIQVFAEICSVDVDDDLEFKLALRGFVWVAASAKTPTSRRRRSRRTCFSDQGRGGHGGGAAGTP